MLPRIILMLLLLLYLPVSQATAAPISDAPAEADSYYQRWLSMMFSDEIPHAELDTVQQVDQFINQAEYRSDAEALGKADQWATPAEFIGRGLGDCEDFAIAKYFTLLAMGVAEEKLKLVFGKLTEDQTEHMVLLYTPLPDKESLLLDNLTPTPTPISLRQDFKPLYSFNQETLWLMQGWQPISQNKGGLKTAQWQRVMRLLNKESLAQLP